MAGIEPRAVRVCFDNNAWSAILNNETDKDLASLAHWITRVEEAESRRADGLSFLISREI